MKKVFMSLAAVAFIATGSLTVVSCGGDEDPAPAPAPTPTPASLKLALITDANEIYAQEGFDISITEADGTPVTGAILIADGEETTVESEDGVFSVVAPAGEYTLSASYDGKTSNEIAITVKPSRLVSEGTGVLAYKGGTMDIEKAYMVYRGLYYADDTQTSVIALWQTEVISGNTSALVQFTTPATPAGGNQYSYEQPGETNTTPVLAKIWEGETVFGESKENLNSSFKVTYADNFYTGSYKLGAAAINGNPFSIEFDGKTPRMNNTGKAGKNVITFENAKVLTAKASNLTVLKVK